MFKRWKSGAKKHSGLLKSAGVQANRWGKDADKALGEPSALLSSIPEKRKDAENSLKDTLNILTSEAADSGREESDIVAEQAIPDLLLPAVELEEPHVESKEAESDDESIKNINVNAEYLGLAIKNYIRQDAITDEVFCNLSGIVLGKELSNAEIASQVLAYGNKDVNAEVKNWVMKHIPEGCESSALKAIAARYFAEHTFAIDILSAISSSDDVFTLASNLFATNHPELSSEIASYLIGDEDME